MSYLDARHEQPTQHATIDWPEDARPGQHRAYHAPPRPYAARSAYAVAQPYSVAPAQHGMPRYATVPSVYGAPALGDDGARRRPGAVTAAAVLAFVLGGLGTLFSLFYLCLFLLLVAATSDSRHGAPWGSVLVVVVGVALLIGLSMSALFIWGGISAVRGKGRRMLVSVSAIQVILVLLELVHTLAGGPVAGPALVRAIIGLVLVVPILVLILRPSSGAFFRARRGRTV